MKKDLDQFIDRCVKTFHAFGFEVTVSSGRASLWNFTCFNPNKKRKYFVYCVPQLEKVKGLIKIMLRKIPPEGRLVVVTTKHTEEELSTANDENYCLVSIDVLTEFGEGMLEIRGAPSANEAQEKHDNLVDEILSKDKLLK